MSSPPSGEKTRAEVRRILAAVLELPEKENFRRTDTPVWDSLKNLEVFFTLEDAFGVEFSEEEIAELDSCESLSAVIVAKQTAG